MVRRSKSTENRYRNLLKDLTVEQIEVIATSDNPNEIRQTINKPNISDDSAFAIKRLVRSFLNRVEREDTRRIETEQTREVIQQVRERNITIARLEERIQQLQQENEQLRQQNQQLQQRTQELEERIQRLEEHAQQRQETRREEQQAPMQADEDEELEDESDEEETIREEDFEGIEDSETETEPESEAEPVDYPPSVVENRTIGGVDTTIIKRNDSRIDRINYEGTPQKVGIRMEFEERETGRRFSVWKDFIPNPNEDYFVTLEDLVDDCSNEYESRMVGSSIYIFG